jgi:hypothetical protein
MIEVSGTITGARPSIFSEGRAPASFFVDHSCLASESLRYNSVLMRLIAWEFLQNSLGSRSVTFEMFFKTYGSLFQYNVLAWFAKRTANLAH